MMSLVCDDGLTNVDGECTIETPPIEDMMSLDWILLMRGNYNLTYVESCDGYIEYEDGYDEYVGYECRCNNWDNECGECRLNIKTIRVNSCDGYELCSSYNSKYYDCCYDYEYPNYDSLGNIIDTEIRYKYKEYSFNEYTLYWNDDLDVCDGNSCDEEMVSNSNTDYDIVIPSHIPRDDTIDCDYKCDDIEFFHPNCDTPIDTTMMIENKSLSFEKMGWFDRNNNNNKFGYIHYYPLDNYLIFEGDDDLDISNYKVVDYQRKE